MFGVLLESNGRHQRRAGGTALSVAMHVAVVGAAAAATAHGAMTTLAPPEVVRVHFMPPPPPARPVAAQRSAAIVPAAHVRPPTLVPHIAVPTIVPTSIPTIQLGTRVSSDSVILGGGGGATGPSRIGLLGGDDTPADGEWRGNDLLMRIITSGKPRYPEALRQTGIGGRVLVRFIVDTLGRVDMKSVEVLQSTHELFTRAVRDALAEFRFKPSELRGRRVASLAEMPFEFAITR